MKRLKPGALGRELKRRRLQLGVSQRDLDIAAETTITSMLERGARNEPGLGAAWRLAQALGMTLDQWVQRALRRG